MDFVALIVICVLYAMVMFLDMFFKSCMMLPYIDFLKSSGITVKFFRIQFHTYAFNRLINRYSSKLPALYKKSFKFGAYVTIILIPFAFSLLVMSIFSFENSQQSSSSNDNSNNNNLNVNVKEERETAHLEILLPGVNLPLNQLVYYVIALLICSVVHEAGK